MLIFYGVNSKFICPCIWFLGPVGVQCAISGQACVAGAFIRRAFCLPTVLDTHALGYPLDCPFWSTYVKEPRCVCMYPCAVVRIRLFFLFCK